MTFNTLIFDHELREADEAMLRPVKPGRIDDPVRLLAAPTLAPRWERHPPPPARYVVMAAATADRRGTTAGLEPADRREIVRLLDNGYRETLTTPSLVVLQLMPDRPARP